MVIVAGAEMYVAFQLAGFPPHHQCHLRVGFIADEAIHYVRASFLQAVRERNVRGLVKSCHQFNDDGHFLAGTSGIDKAVDDGGVGARAIQRLLDGKNVRVGSRRRNEVDDRRE